MLEDRHYMRESQFRPRYSITLTLVIINVAVFLVQTLLDRFAPSLRPIPTSL
jgi:membrane associated rhomboid family serine protease